MLLFAQLLVSSQTKNTVYKYNSVGWTFLSLNDVARDPLWGGVPEVYGEEPYTISVFGVATVKGYQGKNLSGPFSIAACLKHFVGYGESEEGCDYRYSDISNQFLLKTCFPPLAKLF